MLKNPGAPANRASQMAFFASLVTNMVLLGYLAASLCAVDRVIVPMLVSWILCLDQLRLGLGLTCVIRVLITHAEARTLMTAAGFFSYMYFYSMY